MCVNGSQKRIIMISLFLTGKKHKQRYEKLLKEGKLNPGTDPTKVCISAFYMKK